MKKLWAIMISLALMLSLCACGQFVSIMPGTELAAAPEGGGEAVGADETQPEFEEQPFYSFIGWERFGENYYDDTPVALSLQYNVDGAEGCISPIFDRASIVAACDALRNMTVTGKAEADGGTSQMVFTFTMADGEEYSAAFSSGNLSVYAGDYTVTGGEELWEIAFPAYSDEYDLFDLYFDDSVRQFADQFYENRPVSVGRRSNGGATLTSEDESVISGVFEALAGASVTLVENRPDQYVDLNNLQEYVFTMADGSGYTFSFAQECLAVKANASYGTVYYWLGNISPLWDIRVEPEDTSGQFEGGALTGLREDIQLAAEIASGQRDDLSVMGVYVDYTIDGTSGYLTLSDDTAVDFINQLTGIAVTNETVEEPEGERITVSVTLSDWSGPIFYFTGDTVQQVMGVNYVCSSEDMSALRSTIQSLAADGNNSVEVDD